MPAITSAGSGAWNSVTANSPWPSGTIPVSGDTVTIAATHAVTIPDGYAAVCGNSPAAAGVVLQVNGTLTVGGGASGSLQVKGGVAVAPAQALTLNAGSTLFIDGDGNHGQRYLLDCGYRGQFLCNGTAGAHVTVKGGTAATVAGGATPAGLTSGTSSPKTVCAFTDFSYFGTSSAVADGPNFTLNLNYGGSAADWQILLTDCKFDNCGIVQAGSPNPCDGSRFELTRCSWTNSLGPRALEYARDASTTGGTYFLQGCSFDATARFNLTTNLSVTGCYFGGSIVSLGTARWAAFSGNFTRSTLSGSDWYNSLGDFVGNYVFGDTVITNAHGVSFGQGDYDHVCDANVFEAPLADQAGDIVMAAGTLGAGTRRNLTVTRNLVLPNAAGVVFGKLVSFLGDRFTVGIEHNTITSTDARTNLECGLAEYGEGYAGRAGMFSSIRSNIAWTPAGKNPGAFLYRGSGGGTTADSTTDAVAPANASNNAGNNLIATTGGITTAVPKAGYLDGVTAVTAMFSTTTGLGSGDVTSDPAFVDSSRNLAKWGLDNQSTGGTVAQALAKIAADPTRIADLLSYVRAGFRPTASAYNGATYSGDAATTDAAGTALTGTVGAMAYFAPGPVVATTYTLSGPTSGMVNAASTNFTVTPDGTTSGTVTPASTGAGTFSPTSLTWTGDSVAKTFTYTPTSTAGSPHSISITSSPVLAYSGSPIAYAVTGPLAAGTASFVTSGTGGISVSATDATNGTAPYAHQWQRSITSGAGFTDLSGKTALTAIDTTASAGILYYYRLKYTDSAGTPAVIYSGQVSAQLYSGGPIWTGPSNIFSGGLVR
jgi:hypothetical protein